jgi:FkbM family methyltransferase
MKRFLARVIRKFFGKDPYRTIRKQKRFTPAIVPFAGNQMHIVDNVTFLHGREEIFDAEIYDFNPDNNTPYILDCGANIGLSVLFFKQKFPESTVVAFEPDPDIFKVLEKNISNYKLQNVRAIEAAVWIADGELDFQKEGGFSGSVVNHWDRSNVTAVKSTDLRNFMDRKIDFLKIDIEGAEFEVLKNISEKLLSVSNLFIEYHSNANEPQTLHHLLAILQRNGFRYHIKESFSRKKPFIERETMVSMDMQLNVFGYRN